MFEFLDLDNHEDGSEDRYNERIERHMDSYGNKRRHYFWWLVHNCIAHPLIGFFPFGPFFRFHDWTARKINLE